MDLFASDTLACLMPKYQRSLAEQLIAAKVEKEEEILSSVSDILSRLAVVMGSEKEKLVCETQNQNGVLCELPWELIYSIAEKLSLFDYWSLRATCKMLQGGIRAKPEYPLCIYLVDNRKGLYGVKRPHQKNSCCSTLSNHQDDINYIIASTMNGWLLMMSYDQRRLNFVNLFTGMGVYITPHPNRVGCFKSVGFSKHPTCYDRVTVGYWSEPNANPNERDDWESSIAYLCSRYDSSWKHCKLSQSETFSEYPTSVVYHQEAFYFMDRLGHLGVFTLVGQAGHWKFCGKQVDINKPGFQLVTSFILECNGHLVSIFFGDQSSDKAEALPTKVFKCNNAGIKVFRCNNNSSTKLEWVPVSSLGNYSLFIGPSSFSTVPTQHNMRNRIYLPSTEENYIYYYSLETTRFYVVYGVKEKEIDNLSFTYSLPSLWQWCWVV